MRKINNIISSSIAPKDTDALWINPEDRTINIFNSGWVALGIISTQNTRSEEEVVEPEVVESIESSTTVK